MIDTLSNNKRIAKNTFFLYLRMLVMMCVSLFTFRELLKELGVDDYGIYNVVGGVVILFSFLSNAMTLSNQRYLSFCLGQGDTEKLTKTFSMIVNVQIAACILILFFAETIGLWFLNVYMNFDGKDMTVINLVYQFSILTFLLQIIQIPYTSAIISHERMDFFSYFSIGEAILRLSVVLLLGLFAQGRLLIYASLLTISALIVFFVYRTFCIKSFKTCRYRKIWDTSLFKELSSFFGWNMLGGLGNVGASQGVNILFNIFCGVVVNAAMGVSHQVSAAVNSLVGNMQTAFNPQIIKSYASDDITYFNSLIFRAARLSFYLISIVGVPVIVCADSILHLWLTDVPQYAVSFTQFTIAYCMIDAISGPLWIGAQAAGNIKIYTLWLTSVLFIYIPVAYILLKIGYSPVMVIAVRCLVSLILHLYRVIYLGKKVVDFSSSKFFIKVTLRALSLSCLVLPIIYCLHIILPDYYNGFMMLPVYFILSVILGYLILLSKGERACIQSFISNRILNK